MSEPAAWLLLTLIGFCAACIGVLWAMRSDSKDHDHD
jgi:hypothetical protein